MLEGGQSVIRELIMIKVKASQAERQQITALTDIFRANIVDVAKESLMIELIGNPSKLEAFIKMLDGFEILKLVRTGITGLARGDE